MSGFEIRQADLLLVRGTDFISREIERISDGPYSHVAMVVKPNELFEANYGRTAGYQAIDFYIGCSDVLTLDLLTDEQRQRIVSNVLQHLGETYDTKLIAWEMGHYLLHIDLPYVEGNESICSTLVINKGYRPEGFDLCSGIKYPSPNDIGREPQLRKAGSF